MEKKKGGLLVVVSVLTLIVAIIGASFAYFTATASGTENGVSVSAAKIAIEYTDGRSITASDLIPASATVVDKAYNGLSSKYTKDSSECIDDNGYRICAIYGFTVTNNSSETQNITAAILTNLNEFTSGNLKYMVYDVTDTDNVSRVKNSSNPLIVSLGSANGTQSVLGTNLNTTVSIAAGESVSYEVVVFLDETGSDQSDDQDKDYAGTLTVAISGTSGSGLSGQINATSK